MGENELNTILRGLRGMKCWRVTAGGSAGSIFSLDFGKKVLAPRPVRSSRLKVERFWGEADLMVWCCWRLDAARPLVSSDQEANVVKRKLHVLVSRSITSASVTAPAYDLTISFTGGLVLRVFCDQVAESRREFKGNWDMALRGRDIEVGPGHKCRISKSWNARGAQQSTHDQAGPLKKKT
jgi:hypothetical protein